MPMAIDSTLGILLSIMMITLNPYGTFVFQLLAESLVFAWATAFISMNIEKLYGLTRFILEIVSLVQYGFLLIALTVNLTF